VCGLYSTNKKGEKNREDARGSKTTSINMFSNSF
jgi:hypothetical protein